uniref:Uncharacterized protein n=1 Tax=Strigamia maritima TaxID=126957 RepID=T1JGE9_STRMM
MTPTIGVISSKCRIIGCFGPKTSPFAKLYSNVYAICPAAPFEVQKSRSKILSVLGLRVSNRAAFAISSQVFDSEYLKTKMKIGPADYPQPPERHMKFPVTHTAKIVQFPWKFYYNNVWLWRWYFYGTAAAFPIFLWIHKKANSPENVRAWAETQRKNAEKDAEHHHLK